MRWGATKKTDKNNPWINLHKNDNNNKKEENNFFMIEKFKNRWSLIKKKKLKLKFIVVVFVIFDSFTDDYAGDGEQNGQQQRYGYKDPHEYVRVLIGEHGVA